MKLIITSGYFNPIHSGHISYLIEAAKLGDKLIVIVNNDKQIELKGSKPFMNSAERSIIVSNLKCVDEVHVSQSTDKSVCEDLRLMRKKYPHEELIFAKGGDRDEKDAVNPNSPLYYDTLVCKENNITVAFNVGCEKVTSSSEILSRLK